MFLYSTLQYMCVCVHTNTCAYIRACMHLCVCVFVCVCVCAPGAYVRVCCVRVLSCSTSGGPDCDCCERFSIEPLCFGTFSFMNKLEDGRHRADTSESHSLRRERKQQTALQDLGVLFSNSALALEFLHRLHSL